MDNKERLGWKDNKLVQNALIWGQCKNKWSIVSGAEQNIQWEEPYHPFLSILTLVRTRLYIESHKKSFFKGILSDQIDLDKE
jgi:hypothetical protein